MKYECIYNPKLNTIEATTDGPADVAALLEMVHRIAELCGQKGSANIIVDHTASDARPLTIDNIRTLSDAAVSLRNSLNKRKCAQVVADDLQFGFGRAWELMVDSSGSLEVQTRIFRNKDAAVQWITTAS